MIEICSRVYTNRRFFKTPESGKFKITCHNSVASKDFFLYSGSITTKSTTKTESNNNGKGKGPSDVIKTGKTILRHNQASRKESVEG